jgi:hypothetical protein
MFNTETLAQNFYHNWNVFAHNKHGRPVGRGSGAPALGHREAGASAQVVIPCF